MPLIAESGLATALAAGGTFVSGIVLIASVVGGATYAAKSASTGIISMVCGYVGASVATEPGPTPGTASDAKRIEPGLSPAIQAEIRGGIETAAALGVPRTAIIDDIAAALANEMPEADPARIRKQAEQAVTSVAAELCTEPALDGLPTDAVARAGRGVVAVQAALAMRGVPYSWGGGGPNGPGYGIGRGARTKGFDCSGLTEYAWARAGVRIGTTTYEQWRAGVRVPRSQIQPGDLIFYETDPSIPGPDHVGIAIDATRMVHAPFTGSTVRIDTWAGAPSRERALVGIIRPT
ncbi:C40 family peptidase [Microtetraspora malaysiensis]|uniref:C40 family peptidase n=1 Tax=Microtetraspora malaysiensis TaxID=161358 RepID=A0ABW6SR57_9ACTN